MKKISTLLFLLCVLCALHAQDDGTLDTSFLPNNTGQKGVDGFITTMLRQPDGKLLVGGTYATYNQFEEKGLVRLNEDGSMDFDFNQTNLTIGGTGGASPMVNVIAIQPDGKILVGGNFIVKTPFPENELLEEDILRLNPDGTRDETFIAPENTSGCGDIRDIVLQPDGKIIVVGDITSCLASTIDNNENILRLNADGSLDETFTALITDVGLGFSEEPINSVKLQPDGKILIAGNFNEVNGVAQLRLARLNSDGALDTSFSIGSGFNEVVKDLELQSDGRILVVGNFTQFNATSQNQIVRLNTDGSLDPTFDSGDGVGRFQPSNGFTAPKFIEHVNIQPDGKILIGGDYNRYNGSAVSRYTRLNSDGSLDNTFINVDDLGIEVAHVFSSLVLPNGDFILGGSFDSHNNYKKSALLKLTPNGQIDLNFNAGTGPTEEYFATKILGIKKSTANKFYVVGRFREYDDVLSRNIARINSDGSLDTSFSTGLGPFNGFDDETLDVEEQSDGKVIVVGEFENYNGSPANGIARLNTDGSIDPTFSSGNGVDTANNNRINTIAQLPNGQFLIGGFFTQFDGFATRNLARLNSDGSIDTTFFVSNTSQVYDIQLLDNGQFFISVFSYNGDTIVGRLAKINFDGTRDTSFSASGITTGTSEIVKILENGKIIVGGSYSSQGKILKLNADGSSDTTFSPADIDGRIQDIELQEDGKIIIGGSFSFIDTREIRGVARLNSDGSFDETFNPEDVSADPDTYAGTDDFTNTVHTLELRDSGQLLLGGDFRSYNTQPKAPLIALFAGVPATLSLDEDVDTSTSKIFPNPAFDSISITSSILINSIEIYSISGKQLFKKDTINLKTQTLDISQLSTGIYLLKINGTSKSVIKKLVIN